MEFWGMAGFCRLWIPGFAHLAAPLYSLTKEKDSFEWGKEQQQAFENIKRALLSAFTLVLPEISKPFILYVDEKNGTAKRAYTIFGPLKKASGLPVKEN